AADLTLRSALSGRLAGSRVAAIDIPIGMTFGLIRRSAAGPVGLPAWVAEGPSVTRDAVAPNSAAGPSTAGGAREAAAVIVGAAQSLRVTERPSVGGAACFVGSCTTMRAYVVDAEQALRRGGIESAAISGAAGKILGATRLTGPRVIAEFAGS